MESKTARESQNRHLGFWTKAMPSKEESLRPLKKEKKFPVCYWQLQRQPGQMNSSELTARTAHHELSSVKPKL